MTVFQRSPQWAAPFDQFHEPVPEGERWLMRNVQLYRRWYRLRLRWTFNDKVHPALQKDPEWEHPERSVNQSTTAIASSSRATSSPSSATGPDLMAKVLPDYPPFGKRILLDNGWYAALTARRRDAASPTRSRRSTAVVAVNGGHELDVLVLRDRLRRRALPGADGDPRTRRAPLREVWDDDDARAYLGTAVPGFPNLLHALRAQPAGRPRRRR